MIESSNY